MKDIKIGKYLILPKRIKLTFGIHIYNTEIKMLNTYVIQLSAKKPYWYPQIRRNTLKDDDGVKKTSIIVGWLFIYFVKMTHDRNYNNT